MNLTREQRLYLALWRKALSHLPEELEIKLDSQSLAISMRLGLYRALRPFRNKEQFDPQLLEASEKLVVSLGEGSKSLIFKERKNLVTLENLMGELGIEEEDLSTEFEKEVEADLAKLIDEPKRETPFYKRS